jgi:hypothetical protein
MSHIARGLRALGATNQVAIRRLRCHISGLWGTDNLTACREIVEGLSVSGNAHFARSGPIPYTGSTTVTPRAQCGDHPVCEASTFRNDFHYDT